MKTQYRVINRDNRNELILNTSELIQFFNKQNIRNYAVSKISSKKESFIEALALGSLGVVFVILTTKIIMHWI